MHIDPANRVLCLNHSGLSFICEAFSLSTYGNGGHILKYGRSVTDLVKEGGIVRFLFMCFFMTTIPSGKHVLILICLVLPV